MKKNNHNYMEIKDIKKLSSIIVKIYNQNILENHELRALERELKEVEKKFNNFIKAIESGIFNSSTNIRMQELEESKILLQDKIMIASKKSQPILNEIDVLGFLQSFKQLDFSLDKAKQLLIDMFENKVVAFDDHIEIYFNVSDDKGMQLKRKKETQNTNDLDSFDMAENATTV